MKQAVGGQGESKWQPSNEMQINCREQTLLEQSMANSNEVWTIIAGAKLSYCSHDSTSKWWQHRPRK